MSACLEQSVHATTVKYLAPDKCSVNAEGARCKATVSRYIIYGIFLHCSKFGATSSYVQKLKAMWKTGKFFQNNSLFKTDLDNLLSSTTSPTILLARHSFRRAFSFPVRQEYWMGPSSIVASPITELIRRSLGVKFCWPLSTPAGIVRHTFLYLRTSCDTESIVAYIPRLGYALCGAVAIFRFEFNRPAESKPSIQGS